MTIEQRQCLLRYLGYYVGEIDGKWGSCSKEATKAFQKDFGFTGKDVDGVGGDQTDKALKHAVTYGIARKEESAPSGDFWDKIKYFKKSEFACKCGCGTCNMSQKLIEIADDVREHFGAPITVSSGHRCKTHNARVGGVSNSRHLSGKAMDFSVRGKSAAQVLEYVQKIPGIRYAYAIDSNWVHMDVE